MGRAVTLTVILLGAIPAAADDRIAASYMLGRPIAGDTGGADHAIAARWEHRVGAVLDGGLAVQAGTSPGNADDSLFRVALLPTLGASRPLAPDVVLRGDVAIGWQLADGSTKLAGVPVSGTEARGVRAELGASLTAPLRGRVAIRARVALAFAGIYPRAVASDSRVFPLVEIALVLGQ